MFFSSTLLRGFWLDRKQTQLLFGGFSQLLKSQAGSFDNAGVLGAQERKGLRVTRGFPRSFPEAGEVEMSE